MSLTRYALLQDMQQKHVDSSVINTVGYDVETEILQVEFRSGRVYRYFGVPAKKFAALMSADSLGAYFNREIRPRYRSKAVE